MRCNVANKKKTEKTDGGQEVVEWGDERLQGSRDGKEELPSGIHIASPYGRSQVDVGSMRSVEGGDVTPGGMRAGGGATGDDGNTGSSGASTARGGANDA